MREKKIRICLNCNKNFECHQIINGKAYCSYTRKYCFDCLPFLSPPSKTPLNERCTKNGFKRCGTCKEHKPLNEFSVRVRRGNLGRNSRCKKCSIKISSDFKKRQKLKAIEYKGGKCKFCGYNRCVYSLDFHHLNPNEKKFEIAHGIGRKWENLIEELDKCILVCRNCHGEIHEGLLNIGDSLMNN